MKLKLIHKLLIAMIACTTAVLVLNALATRASVGQGFMDFLQQQERSRLETLVPELTEWYRVHGSWQDLAENPREFFYLVLSASLDNPDGRLALGPGRPSLPGREGRRGQNPTGLGPPAGPRQPQCPPRKARRPRQRRPLA